MPLKLVVANARMSARAFCDQCGGPIKEATLAHCAYPEPEHPLAEREGGSHALTVLHKGECTDLFEMKQGHMRFMEFQTFLVRLGNDAQIDWTPAFEAEQIRLA